MTVRRSVDLAVPALERQIEEPPANVLDFSAPPRLPFTLGPGVVFEIALRQRERETAKAVAMGDDRGGAAGGRNQTGFEH